MKLVLFVLFALSGSLWAQTATLRGVVTDESGAVIPKANIALKGPEGLAKTVLSGDRLTIRVKQPETEHTVSVGKLQSWLDGGGKSPNEQVVKKRLREML